MKISMCIVYLRGNTTSIVKSNASIRIIYIYIIKQWKKRTIVNSFTRNRLEIQADGGQIYDVAYRYLGALPLLLFQVGKKEQKASIKRRDDIVCVVVLVCIEHVWGLQPFVSLFSFVVRVSQAECWLSLHETACTVNKYECFA